MSTLSLNSTKPCSKGCAHEFLLRMNKSLIVACLTGYFIAFEKAHFVKEPRGWVFGAN
jgi:hypothetical protein